MANRALLGLAVAALVLTVHAVELREEAQTTLDVAQYPLEMGIVANPTEPCYPGPCVANPYDPFSPNPRALTLPSLPSLSALDSVGGSSAASGSKSSKAKKSKSQKTKASKKKGSKSSKGKDKKASGASAKSAGAKSGAAAGKAAADAKNAAAAGKPGASAKSGGSPAEKSGKKASSGKGAKDKKKGKKKGDSTGDSMGDMGGFNSMCENAKCCATNHKDCLKECDDLAKEENSPSAQADGDERIEKLKAKLQDAIEAQQDKARMAKEEMARKKLEAKLAQGRRKMQAATDCQRKSCQVLTECMASRQGTGCQSQKKACASQKKKCAAAFLEAATSVRQSTALLEELSSVTVKRRSTATKESSFACVAKCRVKAEKCERMIEKKLERDNSVLERSRKSREALECREEARKMSVSKNLAAALGKYQHTCTGTPAAAPKAAAKAAAGARFQEVSHQLTAATESSATTASMPGGDVTPHIVARLPAPQPPVTAGPGVLLEPPPKYSDSNPEVIKPKLPSMKCLCLGKPGCECQELVRQEYEVSKDVYKDQKRLKELDQRIDAKKEALKKQEDWMRKGVAALKTLKQNMVQANRLRSQLQDGIRDLKEQLVQVRNKETRIRLERELKLAHLQLSRLTQEEASTDSARFSQLDPAQMSQEITQIHSKLEQAASTVAAAGAAVAKPIDLSS